MKLVAHKPGQKMPEQKGIELKKVEGCNKNGGFKFNKREEDFSSLKEYNDYLEEVEDMTFNLIEGIDVPAVEAKIAEYEKENHDQIMINRARKAEELAAAQAASKGPAQNDSDGAPNQSSQTGYGTGAQGQYAPTFAGGQPRPTGMAQQPVPLGGGLDLHGYAADDEETMKLRAERGGRAGGWSAELSKKRALEEAFGSIWIY
ncbi:cdk-activating kinase assembly factor mat1 [Quercus suber]|uniref:Cdk-activating kinase assembly factor mat1 n=1 Tax=Quercus suber TaxID=58331 RepID=A0AAW0KG88_QUESU